ncbi:MAG: biotin transporter BioY [Synergistaceae bacterium]|jgi:biotin transport system substrate-specific component|nr:biotin transporter BioY [Synergistaceae bacterium]
MSGKTNASIEKIQHIRSAQHIDTKGIALAAAFSSLIAVGAFIRVPVPLAPFTLQFLFTNLACLTLGKKIGSCSIAAYIAIGLAGVPVFSSGGGPGYIFQPTFGYIIGFLIGGYAAGFVVERAPLPSFARNLAASFLNLFIVYLCGMVYYFFIANFYLGKDSSIGIWPLILYCFILAVPGDIALCFLSSTIAARLKAIKGEMR